MQRVHFISIGGATMHNLAIAVSKKNNFEVSGSDDDLREPACTKLAARHLLPAKPGWFPEKLKKGMSAVVVGAMVNKDNPELLRAQELGLKIYTVPEYVFQQTRSKTRIVVGGDAEKTEVAALIVHVLQHLRIDSDYLINYPAACVSESVKLSYESRIAVIEGDECQTSPLDLRPKFHLYKPHIAVLTGVRPESHPLSEHVVDYVGLYSTFLDLMEFQGRLIYNEADPVLAGMMGSLRRDIVAFGYKAPAYEQREGKLCLHTRYGECMVELPVSKLPDLEAARLACRQIGVTDEQFYGAVQGFCPLCGEPK